MPVPIISLHHLLLPKFNLDLNLKDNISLLHVLLVAYDVCLVLLLLLRMLMLSRSLPCLLSFLFLPLSLPLLFLNEFAEIILKSVNWRFLSSLNLNF